MKWCVVPALMILLLATACDDAAVTAPGGPAAADGPRPVQVTLDAYSVSLGFADGRRCRIEAYDGNRDVLGDGWSRIETDCAGIDSLRVEWLPPLPPPPPDPNFPEPPPLLPDYFGGLDIVRLPSADLDGASVTVIGPGGVGIFTRWPGRAG